MKKNKKLMLQCELAGVVWIIAAFIGNNYVFFPIGICFIAAGIGFYYKK